MVQGRLVYIDPAGPWYESRNRQAFANAGPNLFRDANGEVFTYLPTAQYVDGRGNYYDPVTGARLNAPVNGWYLNPANGIWYYYDGVYYRPYQPPPPVPVPVATPMLPTPSVSVPASAAAVGSSSGFGFGFGAAPSVAVSHGPAPAPASVSAPRMPVLAATPLVSAPASLSTPAPVPAPSSSTVSNSTSGGGAAAPRDNNYFRNLLRAAPSPQDAMYSRVRSAGTLSASLRQLEVEANTSDEFLELAIEELATGSHGMRSGLRGLNSRFSDGRFDEGHSGHDWAEYATFTLFERLLAIWARKGKRAKDLWILILTECKRRGFDQDPNSRGGGGGGGGGALGGSTHAPKGRVGLF